METYANNVQQYNDMLTSESNYVTKISVLFKNICSQPEQVSNTTAENKVNNFKTLLKFFCYAKNPYLQQNTSYTMSPELYSVHYKMICFLTHKKYITITRVSPSVILRINIPTIFMPIFTAYILTDKTPSHTKTPVCTFFTQLEHRVCDAIEIYNASSTSSKLNAQLALDWLSALLNKEYFSNLENMLNRYSTTYIQRTTLYNSVKILSLIQQDIKGPNIQINSSTNKILSHFSTTLHKHSLTKDSKNLDFLYNHYEELKITHEDEYVSAILSTAKSLIDRLKSFSYSFHENNLKNATYPLSINNLDTFTTQFKSFLCEIDTIKSSIEPETNKFYNNLYNNFLCSAETSYYIANNIFILSKENLNYHIDFYTKKLNAYYTKLENICTKYLRIVKLSSNVQPEKLKQTDLRKQSVHSYFSDLDHAYNHLEKMVYNKNTHLPPFVQHLVSGIVEENCLPSPPYDAEQLAHLLSLLDDEKKYSSSYIKSKLSLYEFPVYYDSLIQILENYKQLL